MGRGGSVLRRVAVHAGAAHVDVALPATVPVASLLPAIVDAAAGDGGHRDAGLVAPYRLATPAADALDTSQTLAQLGIRDGSVLVLTGAETDPGAPAVDDVAEGVTARVAEASHPVTARDVRAYCALTATGCAAVAGFSAVPGGPGAPNVLLAAAAAAAVAVPAVRRADHAAVTAVAQAAVLTAAAACAAVLTAAPLQVIGALTAAAGVGVLQICARVAAVSAGLARRVGTASRVPDLEAAAIRAHRTLTGVVITAAAAVALGAVAAAVGVHTTGAPRYGGAVFTGVAAAVLGLRARCHRDRAQALALLTAAAVVLTGGLIAAAVALPQHLLWCCAAAAALIAATACGLRGASSPLAGRAVEVAEYAALVTIAPLTCWICGVFGAARTLHLL